MSDTGSVNVSGEGKVYGTNVGQNSGTVNTTVNVLPPPPPLDLAAARERFAALPLDVVPNVEPLPSGSRMPLSRNPLFVGREPELMRLAATLKGGGTAAIGQVAAATGLGGIGKTQLASEFVHRYGQFFAGGAFWLSFASGESVPAEIAACGGPAAMNLPGFDALKFDDQVGRVVQEWQGPIPRLLVFDNCEDEALLDRWRPKTGGCRVLVTSRRAQWDPALGVVPLALETLPRHESIALLRKFRPDLAEDDGALDAIAAELGDLPLALHLAGSFLALIEGALGRLVELGLIEEEAAGALRLHRLLGTFIRLLPIGAEAQAVVEQAMLEKANRLNNAGYPTPLLELQTHLRLIVDRAVTHRDKRAAELCNTLAYHLQMTGNLRQARPYYEQALAIYREVLGERHPDTARSLNNLSALLDSMGDLTGARPYFEQALAIREHALGPGHPDTAQSLWWMGTLLAQEREREAARAHLRRAVAIYHRALGADHPTTQQCQRHLAALGDTANTES